MILYIFLFILFLLFLFFLYIRITHPFWSIQPVFHFYDIYYWFFNIGIIQTSLPTKNKYTNFKNIKTISPKQLTTTILKQLISFLQIHFLHQDTIHFQPNINNFLPYLTTFTHSSFLSYYIEPELYIDQKTGKTISESKLIGFITSKPLIIYIHSINALFNIYYVDYLCIHKHYRKKNIAPQLIQTHEYQQSHQNKQISVSLFKREGELTGIIPLTVYKTFCYKIESIQRPDIPNNVTILTADTQSLYYVYQLLQYNHSFWQISIYPEYANLLELVKTKNIIIKILKQKDQILAFYVFKHTATLYEKKQVLACCGSFKSNELTNSLFTDGFQYCLFDIFNKYKYYQYLNIEDISHNALLLSTFTNKPISISPTAYFFYNFAYTPFSSYNVFILL